VIIQGLKKMEAARSSEMLVTYCTTTWHHNSEGSDLCCLWISHRTWKREETCKV